MTNASLRRRHPVPASYICSNCGFSTGRWMGFCPQCRSEDSLNVVTSANNNGTGSSRLLREVSVSDDTRRRTGVEEFDRVVGGGVVAGSVLLVGGEPGVGKSTLLLQLADGIAGQAPVLLASAEESAAQVALRSARLGLGSNEVHILSDGSVEGLLSHADELKPALLVVDSIQTVTTDETDGSAGGLAQVRESASRFIEYAKRTGTVVIFVGHVTKDGSIAGPKVLEHMVDVVLYLEGESDGGLRVLRSLKNRYGSVNQVGVFTMGDRGLEEVPDPSGVLVSSHRPGAAGTVLFPVVEGRRPMLCEVQALVVPTVLPQPRRSVKGFDAARLHQLLAVLERHAGFSFGKLDVHVNVVGGMRLRDPAVDLPVALAIVSSAVDQPLPLTAAWGEVGLTGEIRAAPHGERRRVEADRFEPELLIQPSTGGASTLVEALALAGILRSSR